LQIKILIRILTRLLPESPS